MTLEITINIIEQFRWILRQRAILCEKYIKDITPRDVAKLFNHLATEKIMNSEVEIFAVSE